MLSLTPTLYIGFDRNGLLVLLPWKREDQVAVFA